MKGKVKKHACACDEKVVNTNKQLLEVLNTMKDTLASLSVDVNALEERTKDMEFRMDEQEASLKECQDALAEATNLHHEDD